MRFFCFHLFKQLPTPQHLNTSTPQHLNTSTPQHLNTSTPQHLNTSTPQHLNTSTPQHLNTSTPQSIDSSPYHQPETQLPPWAVRAGLRFVFEVPFNNIAANTVPDNKTIAQSISHILKSKGPIGFYSGGNIELLRSTIWLPRMWMLENAPQHLQSDLTIQSPHAIHSLTACGVAATEAVFMPLFRIRNAAMLSNSTSIFAHKSHILNTLYAGNLPKSIATFISWDAYLYANSTAEHYFTDSRTASVLLTSSAQLASAIVTTPLYVVILNRQHPTDHCTRPFWQSLSHQYRLHGMPLFYRTAAIGSGHLVLQALLTNFSCSISY